MRPWPRASAYLITMAEGASLHLDRLKTRHADYDPDVRDRLIAGAMIPGAWVTKAQKLRRAYRDAVLNLFATVDVMIAPATPCRGAPDWPADHGARRRRDCRSAPISASSRNRYPS
jgi:Asp-tRNA(Asn)/Glu-tRNA(Gln) amidotransferase A subunit family amidase